MINALTTLYRSSLNIGAVFFGYKKAGFKRSLFFSYFNTHADFLLQTL
tara:strand:- start:7060 stop:7203 length:144 start_codon:yes stop_codon:yes gene_type:complete